jgi:hypothetical protein
MSAVSTLSITGDGRERGRSSAEGGFIGIEASRGWR